MSDLLARITGPTPPPSFALLHRPESGGRGRLDVLAGEVRAVRAIADIPLASHGADRHESLVVVPYRQIAERGYACRDDGTPILVMSIDDQASTSTERALELLPRQDIQVLGGGFDLDDEAYAEKVRRVVTEEIGRGAGANFVLKRTYAAQIRDWSPRTALAFFCRLLRQETGAYWTYLVHTGTRTLVGASPERHVSLEHGTVTMNPISGTYRYPPSGPTTAGLLDFLADRKEANELYMVVDEELKMMSRICDGGGRVLGPRLKEMGHLAHTEYLIEGRSTRDVREIIRETMFAPTVTGSPLQSASEVIARFEPEGRGFYAGMVALLGRDSRGDRRLDSAILIRTADIDVSGEMRIGVGATLVRDSDPWAEAEETKAKAAGLLAALVSPAAVRPLAGRAGPVLGAHPGIRRALAERNAPLAPFWRQAPHERIRPLPHLTGRKALLIDAEDTFTAMGATILRALGLEVEVHRFDEDYRLADNDLVVIGPGPGDPRDLGHPKMAHLREVTGRLLAGRIPFLSVCLGHQVLSALLGLRVVRKPRPNQGVQRKINLLGRTELAYFYNSYAALCPKDSFHSATCRGPVRVWWDSTSGEVHALRGRGFASVQFHTASVMTQNGPAILGELLTNLLKEDQR